MFSKFERSAAQGERGNAAVVALCVTTLAVGVVMAARLLNGSGSSKPVVPIAATNIGAGESDADPSGTARASSGPITSSSRSSDASADAVASSGTAGGATPAGRASSAGVANASSPVPTLPGSVPTIPPNGVVAASAPVPVVAVEAPTTTPPIILGLKTPQAASRNLFDAWKENDLARARRFASPAAVEVIFSQAWGAEVQDDGCSETSNSTSFHCAFIGDEIAWVVVVDQRIGPSGREFVPSRTIKSYTKKGYSLSYAPPIPEAVAAGGSSAPGPGPTTTIDPLLLGDAPLVDPAETLDLANPAVQDPSLLDPAGAAAALADLAASGSDLGVGGNAGSVAGAATGAKPSAPPTPKATKAKKKKATIRRPKSAVSSSKSAASTDAALPAGASDVAKPIEKVIQPGSSGSGGVDPAPAGGAVKAGAPPVNQVDG